MGTKLTVCIHRKTEKKEKNDFNRYDNNSGSIYMHFCGIGLL